MPEVPDEVGVVPAKMFFTGPEIVAVRFKKAPRQEGHFFRFGEKMPVKKTATEIMVFVERMGWRRVHTTERGRFYAIVGGRRAYIRAEDIEIVRKKIEEPIPDSASSES